MATVLGLLGIVAFIGAVIALASAVTWTVVKVTPDKSARKREQPPAA